MMAQKAEEYVDRKDDFLDEELLKVGSYIFVWVIGLHCTLYILIVYSSVFKPLAVAALTVSILEWLVTLNEYLLWKTLTFVFLLIRKIVFFVPYFVLMLLCCCRSRCCRCCPATMTKMQNCKDWLKEDLVDRQAARYPWQPIFAGRNPIFRTVSLIVTVLAVFTFFAAIINVLRRDIESFINSGAPKKYSDEFNMLCRGGIKVLKTFPTRFGFLPNTTKEQMQDKIDSYTNYTGGGFSQTQSEQVEAAVTNLMSSIVGESSAFVSSLVFYLIYCIIWMCDPLHVNVDPFKAEHASKVYNPLWTFWRASDIKETKHLELVKTFMTVKRDARQDLQERIYNILRVYFALKVVMNFIFAACNYILFQQLNLDLRLLLGMACFLLSFIPELGTMIAFVVPLPVLVLSPDIHDKGMQFLWLLLGQFAIKMVVSNIGESIVMGRQKVLMGAEFIDDVAKIKETHPVVIIFFVVFTGKVWGAVGMLICVPLISVFRLTMNFWKYEAPSTPDFTPTESQKKR